MLRHSRGVQALNEKKPHITLRKRKKKMPWVKSVCVLRVLTCTPSPLGLHMHNTIRQKRRGPAGRPKPSLPIAPNRATHETHSEGRAVRRPRHSHTASHQKGAAHNNVLLLPLWFDLCCLRAARCLRPSIFNAGVSPSLVSCRRFSSCSLRRVSSCCCCSFKHCCRPSRPEELIVGHLGNCSAATRGWGSPLSVRAPLLLAGTCISDQSRLG